MRAPCVLWARVPILYFHNELAGKERVSVFRGHCS